MPVSKLRGRVATGGPFWSAPGAALHLGDVRECLRRMPARSVHCCVTSPPYWGLRDYAETKKFDTQSDAETWVMERAAQCNAEQSCGGVVRFLDKGATRREVRDEAGEVTGYFWVGKVGCESLWPNGQWHAFGAEPSPDCGTQGQAQCGGCFVCAMVGVFREVWRVLRGDGTVWLNLGDTYASSGRGTNQNGQGASTLTGGRDNNDKSVLSQRCTNLPPGNLVGVPWRVALALQADGWVLRQDIIWHSTNKIPESVTNRCTKSHEHIFLLAKGEGYYYDAVAIEEEATTKPHAPGSRKLEDDNGSASLRRDGGRQNVVWGYVTKNKRDVWILPASGYPGAHFAVYSPRLITPCILAGTSEYGCCSKCGAPYERVVTKRLSDPSFLPNSEKDAADTSGKSAAANASRSNRAPTGKERDRSFDWSRNGKPGTGSTLDGEVESKRTAGWRKACSCQTDEVVPAVVLDPFVGSGTTVATAMELGRAGVGIDLSEAYLRECAVPRIEGVIAGGSASGRRRAAGEVVVGGIAPLPVERMRGV